MLNAFPRLLYFQKKNVFTGDHLGMRIRMGTVETEEGQKVLRAWVWPEPLCFSAADPADVLTQDFEVSEAGLAEACDWVRLQYDSRLELWMAHYAKPKT